MTKRTVVAGILLVLGLLVFSGDNYAEEKGLIGYWKFDEGTGTVTKDFSGKGNNGNIYGAEWVSGKIGQALSFDGAGDYVDCGNDASLNTGDVFTFSLWVYPREETRVNPRIVNKHDEHKNNYQIWSKGDSASSFGAKFVRNGTACENQADIVFEWDKWYHLVVVFENSAIRFYVNGSLVPNKEGMSAGAQINANLFLGQSGDYSYFNGLLDEVRIYNRALNPTEIRELYQRAAGK